MRTFVLAVFVSLTAAGSTARCQEKQTPTPERKFTPGVWALSKRVPWTTSRVVGTPEPPPPFRAVHAFAKLKFANPLYLLAEPATGEDAGKGRLFVVEQRGKIVGFVNDADVKETVEFVHLKGRETYGMTFHPRYAENRWVYVFSNLPTDDMKTKKNRVSRFTVGREAPFVCNPDSEAIIIEWDSNGHNGGDLAFGPDGMLYISAGDGTSDSDTNLTGQKISDLNSGMIRIDVERPEPGQGYSIPKDNPFFDIPDARHELWAYGFRNPWRIHFDPQGNLWCGDIGQDQWEMVEIVRRGDNYGWSIVEGGHPFYLEREQGPHPIVKPLIAHPHSEARSITGGVTYLGTRFPELHGAYIYGDFATGKIWAARYDRNQLTEHREIADTETQVLGFGIDRAGEIYLVDYAGLLWTLERTPPETEPREFPRRLSETGLFESVKGHVAVAGLLPYSVNSPLWSDNAHKERFIGLPGTSKIEFTESGAWQFPEGAVLVKSFALEADAGQPETRKWIETRLLVIQQKEWAGYSYLWNDEQTDAELVATGGADRMFRVRDAAAPGGEREQTWHYPSRAECMVCHSRAAGFVLGLNTLQMNRDHDYAGKVDNQLRTFEHIKLFSFRQSGKRPGGNDPRALVDESVFVSQLPKRPKDYGSLPDPADETLDLEVRVRSYLHANCSQCHVEAGGGNSAMVLSFTTARDKMNVIDVPPQHDKFGLPDARIVAPGAPERSVLLERISRRGKGQMPPLASAVPDEAGIRLIRRWIESLKK
jgi:uncharacterized repeat protein (TIGR03806 family)